MYCTCIAPHVQSVHGIVYIYEACIYMYMYDENTMCMLTHLSYEASVTSSVIFTLPARYSRERRRASLSMLGDWYHICELNIYTCECKT